MRLESWTYLCRRGIGSLWYNRLMTLASMGSLTVCLMLVGAAVLCSAGVHQAAGTLGEKNRLEVFLTEDTGQTDVDIIALELNRSLEVDGYTYYSREDNLFRICQQLEESPETLLALPSDNPFLASFEVKLRRQQDFAQLAGRLQGIQGVEAVKGSSAAAGLLEGLRRSIIMISGGIILLLLVVSMLIVSNTIRLTVWGRRREIGIMRVVGATGSFIRIPFLVEGVLIGWMSSLLALAGLYGLCCWLGVHFSGTQAQQILLLLGQGTPINELWLPLLLIFAVTGGIVGLLGGGWFIRKYLRV